ncbi:MAG: AI-2E family transporter [Pseudomonadota bacterium]
MALPAREQAKYWSVAAVAVFVTLWTLGDVILPFVLGAAVAYFFDPVADSLERLGLPRIAAVAIMTFAGLLLFVLLTLLIIPTIVGQAADLFAAAPDFVRRMYTSLVTRFPDLQNETSTIRQSLEQLADLVQSKGDELLQAALDSVSSILGIVTLLVITPVVSFYLLLDWDRLVERVDDLLPRDHAPTIRRIMSEIDATLAGFIRGQGTVCLILGTYYSIALMLVGLDFGLIVGAVAGLLTFIPYIGALVGGALALGIAVFQFWGDWHWIALVAVIFFSGQFVEGNVLTPKLVGSSVGLHPVWLLFALSVFGALFGFVGMLVAVPIAAVIGVIVRFVVAEYMSGRLYRGVSHPDAMRDVGEQTHDARPLSELRSETRSDPPSEPEQVSEPFAEPRAKPRTDSRAKPGESAAE